MPANRPPRLALVWLSLITAILVAPLVWLVLTSLKTPGQIAAEPYSWWPWPFRWQNYVDALNSIPFLRYLGNTLLLCTGNVGGTLFSCTLAGYAFGCLQWRGRDVLFAILIATLLLPWQVTMVPRFLIIRELGLYNTLGALIVPKFLGEAFYIFLLRQFFRTIPHSLIEQARLDGCTELGILCRVILPLSRPALLTVALLEFVASWNDYGGPLLYLNDPQKFPLAYGLEQFVSSHSSELHLLLAAAVMFALPIAGLFLMLQKSFVRGITTTGLKG